MHDTRYHWLKAARYGNQQCHDPEELVAQAHAAAEADGKTVDEVASEVLQRHLTYRALDRFKREAELRRRGRSDDQIEQLVERAIDDVRSGGKALELLKRP